MKKLFYVYYVRRRGTLFDVVKFQSRYPGNPFLTNDTCLTHLCKHVKLTFVQHMDRIKHVGFILKVLYQFPFCVE